MDIHEDVWLNKLAISKNSAIASKLTKNYLNLEIGVFSPEEFLNQSLELLDFKFTPNELTEAFCSIIGEEIDGMSSLINRIVSKGYKLAFFSDTSAIHMQQIIRNLSFDNLVIGGVFSYEVGALKPDKKMYETFEKRYGKPAIYIDDKISNCEGAEKFNWPTCCFDKSPEAFNIIKKILF